MAINQSIYFRPSQAERYSAYVLYTCLSPLIGLVRLICALGALLGDYCQKGALRERVSQQPELGFDSLQENQHRINRNWQQLGRAILEMTVVGGFFYAMTEAPNRDVPIFQHDRMSEMVFECNLLIDTDPQ